MSATIEKKQAAKDLPVQGTSEKREILENYFQKKILGKQEHDFIPGVTTAAEAALRPKKGKVLSSLSPFDDPAPAPNFEGGVACGTRHPCTVCQSRAY